MRRNVFDKMGIIELINKNWNEGFDPRTEDLPLVKSNYLFPSIIIVYLYIVLKWGPNYMKNRKPYDLRIFIRCYNVVQILINAYLIIQFFRLGIIYEPSKLCVPLDFSLDPISTKIAHTLYLAWMLRFVDLVETVVFVLRKKNQQVSFLHLYHHIAVLSLFWHNIKFYAVKIGTFPIIVNCFVHVVMYLYYFFSTYGDKTPKILIKMKPLLTIIQMVQFILLMSYTIVSLLPSCPLPKIPALIHVINLMILFALFYNFYQKTYKAQKKQKA